ncbi:hypothetical protein Tco_1053073, partial [Tanacetum coccineum]
TTSSRIINPLIAAEIALDEALVSKDNRVVISKSNMRTDPSKTQQEATYQVVLDTLKLSPCYNAFLITADVLAIYMQKFWFTNSKIKDSSSYKFKLDNNSYKFGLEVLRKVLQICPRLHKKKFVKTPSHEETVAFIKEIGYKRDLESITELYIDHMCQPWRTFASIINRRKPTGVVIKDTPDVSKKKTMVQTQNHKGMEMLSDAALLEEAQMKKAIKISKQETRFQH